MVGWHYRLNGHEFEQTPADAEGQGNIPNTNWGCLKSYLISYSAQGNQ